MNVVAGIGWIDQREYGCVRRRLRKSYPDLRSLRSALQECMRLASLVNQYLEIKARHLL